MAAQNGGSVILGYGAQGAQQLGITIVLDYASLTGTRRMSSATRGQWGGAAFERTSSTAVFAKANELRLTDRAGWAARAGVQLAALAPWVIASARDRNLDSLWSEFEKRLQPEARMPWGTAVRNDNGAHAPWGVYERHLRPEARMPWAVAAAHDERAGMPWGGPMQVVQPGHLVRVGKSVPSDWRQYIPWTRYSTLLGATTGVVIPVHDPATGTEALYIVPIQRVYMQLNSASLRRVDGNVALPTFSLSLSLDSGSWVWGFDASLPADMLSVVEPVGGVPVELEAAVNGTTFRLLADRIARERTFGKATIRVSGRGKAALLDSPYSQIYTFNNPAARTAQQLMNEALGVSAVGLGWAIDWAATDWLVPAGVWSHTGSQISAINAIAAAAGLYIQPHASAQTLSVLKQYPFAPWDWGTVAPDYELPADVVTRESIDWVDKTRYNRVFVSGTRNGVLGQVTRTGTAGDLVAPLVTDALVTHADAARQRGTVVLSDTGRIANVSLRLPVLALTGVILPGKFVRYVDGATTRLGIVRSTSLDVSLPGVWQTIGVETHVS